MTAEVKRRRFWLDLAERAAKSFIQGFSLAWTAGAAGIAPGDWAGSKALLAGAGMAGLSAVFSGLSRLRGDSGSASAANLEAVGAPPVAPPPEPRAIVPDGNVAPPLVPVAPAPDGPPVPIGQLDDDLLDGGH